MSGKGSTPRPKSVDEETFGSNWDRIFSKKDCEYIGPAGDAHMYRVGSQRIAMAGLPESEPAKSEEVAKRAAKHLTLETRWRNGIEEVRHPSKTHIGFVSDNTVRDGVISHVVFYDDESRQKAIQECALMDGPGNDWEQQEHKDNGNS